MFGRASDIAKIPLYIPKFIKKEYLINLYFITQLLKPSEVPVPFCFLLTCSEQKQEHISAFFQV